MSEKIIHKFVTYNSEMEELDYLIRTYSYMRGAAEILAKNPNLNLVERTALAARVQTLSEVLTIIYKLLLTYQPPPEDVYTESAG